MTNIKKNDVTRKQLEILLTKFIKDCSKRLSENCFSVELNIEHRNWYCGSGKERKWSNTEIYFNGNSYRFYDNMITDNEFLTIITKCLKDSKCKGNITTKEWEESNPNGWWYSPIKHIEFDNLVLLGKPCKEFSLLNRLIKKYTNKELTETEINTSTICGKRSSWSIDNGTTQYLCYDKKKCQKVVEWVRSHKSSKDVLLVEVKNKQDHGDEEDYRIAQYQETEWYGSDYNYLSLKVLTPKGKEKAYTNIYANNCY